MKGRIHGDISIGILAALSFFLYGCPAPGSGRLSSAKIAYSLHEPEGTFLWVMNADGSGKVRLGKGASPCWSPDGLRIAFEAESEGNRDIYHMKADGTDIIRLTTDPAEDVYPAWSPDGSMIAFNSDRSGSPQIWRMNVASGDGQETWGDNLTQLTRDIPNRRCNNYHSWSPDGFWLAFEADRDRDDPEIYIASATDGTGQRRLTFSRALDEVPAWSPDNRQIIFSSDMHNRPKSGDYEIYIMNADGSLLRRLTDMPEAASNPSMSPDGSKIVFDSGPEDRPGIWMMDRDGSRLRRIADGAEPSWSPSMKNGKR